MQRRMIYFDCNATTPLIREAADASISTLTERFANPSSVHWEGCLAQRIRETARARAAQLLSAKSDEIIFTSGATESLHTAIFSAINYAAKLKRMGQPSRRRLILFGETEHKVVPEALRHWNEILGTDLEIAHIPVDRFGQYDGAFLRQHLGNCFLLCTMAVNNETGVVQDFSVIQEIMLRDAAAKQKALWLVDGVQALGKIELGLDAGLVDYCAFSGHKVYAPKGTGILFARLEAPYFPLFVGGGQEAGRRSGTEALPALSGLSQVLHWFLELKRDAAAAEASPFRTLAELHEFRAKIVGALSDAFPGFELSVPTSSTVPSTVHFAVKGFSNTEIWVLLEAHGVLVSSGSACQSAKVAPSHVVKALKVEPWMLASATRLSFGLATHASEVAEGCRRIANAGVSLRQACDHTRSIVRVSNGLCAALCFKNADSKSDFVIGACQDLDLRLESHLRESPSAVQIERRDAPQGRCRSATEAASEIVPTMSLGYFASSLFANSCAVELGQWKLGLLRHADEASLNDRVQAIVAEHLGTKQMPLVLFADAAAQQLFKLNLLNISLGLGIVCADPTDGVGFPFCIVGGKFLGANDLSAAQTAAIPMTRSEWETQKSNYQLVDVRESFERKKSSPFAVAFETLSSGFAELASAPVSEICSFILQEDLEDPERKRMHLFVCRSGKRADTVAALFRLLGWQHARSVEGGLSGLASTLEG